MLSLNFFMEGVLCDLLCADELVLLNETSDGL